MNDSKQNKWPAVMIDIETLGVKDDAVILEIGVRCFDAEKRAMGPGYAVILRAEEQRNRHIEVETLKWWLEDDNRRPELSFYLFAAAARPMPAALDNLCGFFEQHTEEGKFEIWAKGDFDTRILEHAFRGEGLSCPWEYYQKRELRTVLKVFGIPKGEVAHQALGDADAQVGQLFEALDMLPKAEVASVQFPVFSEERAGPYLVQALSIQEWAEQYGVASVRKAAVNQDAVDGERVVSVNGDGEISVSKSPRAFTAGRLAEPYGTVGNFGKPVRSVDPKLLVPTCQKEWNCEGAWDVYQCQLADAGIKVKDWFELPPGVKAAFVSMLECFLEWEPEGGSETASPCGKEQRGVLTIQKTERGRYENFHNVKGELIGRSFIPAGKGSPAEMSVSCQAESSL